MLWVCTEGLWCDTTEIKSQISQQRLQIVCLSFGWAHVGLGQYLVIFRAIVHPQEWYSGGRVFVGGDRNISLNVFKKALGKQQGDILSPRDNEEIMLAKLQS